MLGMFDINNLTNDYSQSSTENSKQDHIIEENAFKLIR